MALFLFTFKEAMRIKTTDTVVNIIEVYIKTFLDRTANTYDELFAYNSYSKFAARNMISILKNHQEVSPLILMEEYRDKLEDYSKLNTNSNYIFETEKRTIEDIIRYLIT